MTRRRRRVESIWGSTRNPGRSTPMNPSSSRKSPLNHHNVSCCGYGDRTRGPKRLTGRQRRAGKEMGFIGTRGNDKPGLGKRWSGRRGFSNRRAGRGSAVGV